MGGKKKGGRKKKKKGEKEVRLIQNRNLIQMTDSSQWTERHLRKKSQV